MENGREYILHTKSFFHLKLLLPHDDRRKKRKNCANDVDATVYKIDAVAATISNLFFFLLVSLWYKNDNIKMLKPAEKRPSIAIQMENEFASPAYSAV